MHIRHILQLGALLAGTMAVGCATAGGTTGTVLGGSTGVTNGGGTTSAGGASTSNATQGGGPTAGGSGNSVGGTSAGNSPTGGSVATGSSQATGGANNPTTGGSKATGGSSSAKTGGAANVGGTSSGNGGDAPTGGSDAAGGTSAAPTCVGDPTQLINADGWNCDLDTTIQMQGSVYPYGDGTSCPFGPDSPSTNICTASAGCCLSGTTTISDATTSYANWGCGIGMELNSSGGDTPVKSAYAGPVQCFDITLTGSSGGNEVRIGFTQVGSATTEVAPFVSVAAFTSGWKGQICFKDAECADWAVEAGTCTKEVGAVGTPYDMQIQISAGSTAASVGAYNVCISSIVPVVDPGNTGVTNSCSSATGGPGTITDPYGTAHVTCSGKDYIVQNNVWGSSAAQTITYGTGTKFKVTNQTGNNSGDAPVSYPSLFIGANNGRSTASSGLPLAVSAITATGLKTSWTWAANGATGSYNAAYDVWFSTSSGGDPSAAVPSGGYLMVWFHKPTTDQPIGTQGPSVTLEGKNWNVWSGNNSGSNKPCVSYVAQTDITSLTYNLGAFIRDAVDNKRWGTSVSATGWYLTNVYSGFEIWSGGVGVETKDFAVAVP
jgi:hypothetical protein